MSNSHWSGGSVVSAAAKTTSKAMLHSSSGLVVRPTCRSELCSVRAANAVPI